MADITDFLPGITSVSQTNAIIYIVSDPSGSAVDAVMTPDEFFKARTGNKNIQAYASLSAAVAAIGSSPAVIEIPATTTVSASLTVPSNVTLQFTGPGMVSVSAGQTLTINGPIVASSRQIFTGAGAVRGGANVETIYARWFGSKEDNSTDDTAAIQKALDAFTDAGATSFRAGVVRILGVARITNTLNISNGYVMLEGTGWGISLSATPRGVIRWDGAAGIPMILIQDVVASGVRNIRLVGKSSAKPSAAIEFKQAGGSTQDQPILENLWIGSYYGSDVDNAVQFDVGILFSGAVNGDTGMFRNIHIQQCTTAIFNNNVSASVHHWDTMTIGFSGTGFKTVAPQQLITNLLTGSNDVDFDLAGTGVDLTLHNYVCEGSGRMMISSAGAGSLRFKVDGGGFHLQGTDTGGKFQTTDFGGKRWLIDVPGNRSAGLSLILTNFSLSSFGVHAPPAIRAWNTSDNINPDGETQVNIILDEVKGFTSDMFVVGSEATAQSQKVVVFNRQAKSTSIGAQRTTFVYSPTHTEDRTFRDLYSYGIGGFTHYGGPLKVKQLATPSGVAATPTGGSGTTYGYRVSALSYDGETLASATVTCSGSATLSSTVYNTITFAPVPGAYAYKIYGRTSGSEQLLKTLTVQEIADTYGGGWRDTGAVTPSGALPTVNTTGNSSVFGTQRLVKTDDGAGNAEYLETTWQGGAIAYLRSTKTGTGTARPLKIDAPDFAVQIGGVDAWGIYVDHMLYPGQSNTKDIGSDSFLVRAGYFGTMVKTPKINFSVTVTPSGTGDTQGTTGDMRYDDNFLYLKTSVGWKRVALNTF
jgi:hypothetical protein